MRVRGYNLVEIALILTVILMMSSFLAANYFNIQKVSRNQEADRQVQQIKDAVVNYAAANVTRGVYVDAVNNRGFTPLTVRWSVPPGRPYLPCPDITGDGIEDRTAASDEDVLTVTVGVDYSTQAYPLEAGGCVSSRGAVPWRTLNTPPADPWGNRYTYRVAGAFSDPLSGFDQSSPGNSYPASRPLSVIARIVVTEDAFDFNDHTVVPRFGPWPNGANLRNYRIPSAICSTSPCPPAVLADAATQLVAGQIAAVNTTLAYSGVADFSGAVEVRAEPGDLVAGVPFVIVSHGRNGYGAVSAKHRGYVCNPFPIHVLAQSPGEVQNAVWHANTGPGVRVGGVLSRCPRVGNALPEAGFVDGITGTRVQEDDSGYDDIVGWMSVHELVSELTRRRTLPAGSFPPIGLER